MSARRPPASFRPGSPLSPKMDSLALPSQAPRRRPAAHHRPQPSSHHSSPPMKLPALPRFHPANFAPSQHSSVANTPVSGLNSPQPPTSPRAAQRQYSDAQRQLFVYQRDIVAQASRGAARGGAPSGSTSSTKPVSPRLIPLGSPGPVTPLELEAEAGYLLAGARSPGLDETSQNELVQRLIQEEAQRRDDMDQQRPVTAPR